MTYTVRNGKRYSENAELFEGWSDEDLVWYRRLQTQAIRRERLKWRYGSQYLREALHARTQVCLEIHRRKQAARRQK